MAAQALAAAALAGGIQGATGGLSNLWAAKENRKREKYQQRLWQDEWQMKISERDLNWQRENDWEYKMAQMAKAGINPYMALGGVGQPSTSSTSGTSPQQPDRINPPGFDIMAQAVPLMLDGFLKKTQGENIQADTAKKKAETDGQNIENQWLPAEKSLGIENTQALIANNKKTNEQIIQSIELLKQQTADKEQDVARQKLSNTILEIQSRYEESRQKLINESYTINNQKSRKEIDKITKELQVMDKNIQYLGSLIELNGAEYIKTWQDYKTSEQYSDYLDALTQTEDELRPFRKWESGTRSFNNVASPILDAINIFKPKREFETFKNLYDKNGSYYGNRRIKVRK